jgi:hypothetical protein
MPMVRRVPLAGLKTIAAYMVGREIATLTEFEALVYGVLLGDNFVVNDS